MLIKSKDLGRLTGYNGVTVSQTKHHIKLSNEINTNKVLNEHDWILDDNEISSQSLPMKDEIPLELPCHQIQRTNKTHSNNPIHHYQSHPLCHTLSTV